MADERMYMLQPSFAGGEISPDVANRVDLGKYQSALLQAKNTFVRPYGSVYRRPGLIKRYKTDATIKKLQEFAAEDGGYLLEFRESILRIYRDDGNDDLTLVQTITGTPYSGGMLKDLRFAQSADVMFIVCGAVAPRTLKRTSDTTFVLSEYIPEPGYIDEDTYVDGETITPSHVSGTGRTLTYSGNDDLFTGQVGNWVQIRQDVKVGVRDLNINVPNDTTGKETGVIHASAVGWSVSSSGTWTGTLKLEYSSDNQNWNTLRTYTSKDDFNVSETGTFSHATYVRLSGSISLGHLTATLTVSNSPEETKTLNINVGSSSTTDQTNGLLAGEAGWKVVTHGTWTGTFEIQQSTDNSTWTTLRSYSSKDDFNVTETGTFDDLTYIRLYATIKKGNFSGTLTRLSYERKGLARITDVTDGQHCTVKIYKKFAYAEPADDWALGSWSSAYGYPTAIAFFQDRLCFAGNKRQPYMLWMSRTADYWNFDVETAAGEVLDDSAVALAFLSRRDFQIKHLLAFTDLVVMTTGNEWIVSGAEAVTPKQATPKLQTSRGCTDVEPELIGGQIVFVQQYGKTVRDMQYNYATDNYDGADLSLLAKHLTKNATIVDSAYMQEPDSMMFFVLSDGTCACLTYIYDQKVFAWSKIVTDGTITNVEAIHTPYGEKVYFTVLRYGNEYIEELSGYPGTDEPMEFCMLDCAAFIENLTPSAQISCPWLANRTVDILADGRHIEQVTLDANGDYTMDVPAANCVVGLRYETVIETPNIEIQLRDGSMQGRRKKVSEVILRLSQSLGGRVGINEEWTDVIKYDELFATPVPEGVDPELIPPTNEKVKLFSGDKRVTVPNIKMGGFNDQGRVVLVSDDPYPFLLSSIVRVVVLGG